jgi:hypothetical protein
MCSSSVLTRFIPVFFITNILLSFVLPVILIALLYGSGKSKRFKAMCMSFLPPLLFPFDPVAKNLFSPHIIMSKLLHHIALLLTFGVACPPLAVAILVTVSITTMAWQLLTGRYIAQRREDAGLSPLSDKNTIDTGSHRSGAALSSGILVNHVNKNSSSSGSSSNGSGGREDTQLYEHNLFVLNSLCDGVWLCPQTSIWVIIDCTAFFSSLLVFDISGDRSGWLVASVAFSLPILFVPLVLRVIFVYKCSLGSYMQRKEKSDVLPALGVHSVQTSPLSCHDI